VVVAFLEMVLVKTRVGDRGGGTTVVMFSDGRGAETILVEEVTDSIGVRLVVTLVWRKVVRKLFARALGFTLL
jgi:hypothetical protein